MLELTASQISDLLRKCSSNIVCDGCPLHAEHPRCVWTLMQSAAGMINGQGQLIDEQAAKIEALRKLADEYFK